jgi:hypothetical protein
MQEAKYSLNLKFNYEGFDTQLTLRDDDGLNDLLQKFKVSVVALGKLGATPERRWENGKKGNGNRPTVPSEKGSSPVKCVKCGSTNLELIVWKRDGEGKRGRPPFMDKIEIVCVDMYTGLRRRETI